MFKAALNEELRHMAAVFYSFSVNAVAFPSGKLKESLQ
jgi:hypothetical protein